MPGENPANYPNLRPWQPGQSGNPKGRPKRAAQAIQALLANTPRAAEKLKELLDCGHPPTELRCVMYILDSCPESDKLPKDYPEALRMLRERLETGRLRLVDTEEELPLLDMRKEGKP
jgi:hypothetical protein